MIQFCCIKYKRYTISTAWNTKFDRSVFMISNPISYLFGVYMAYFLLYLENIVVL